MGWGLRLVKWLQHIPALQQRVLFSLTHQRIRGDLNSMFRIVNGPTVESISTPPTRTGLRGSAFKFYQQRCSTRGRQYAFSIWAAPFWDDSQCIVCEIIQDPSRRQLAVPAYLK